MALVPGTLFIICTSRVEPQRVVMLTIATGRAGSPTSSANLNTGTLEIQNLDLSSPVEGLNWQY